MLVGIGADEQLAGYARHRTKYRCVHVGIYVCCVVCVLFIKIYVLYIATYEIYVIVLILICTTISCVQLLLISCYNKGHCVRYK